MWKKNSDIVIVVVFRINLGMISADLLICINKPLWKKNLRKIFEQIYNYIYYFADFVKLIKS